MYSAIVDFGKIPHKIHSGLNLSTLTLSPNDASKPLHFLHLRLGTITALRKARLRSIGKFVACPRAVLRRKFSASPRGRCDTDKALHALSCSITKSGKVDWTEYARCFDLPIFPTNRKRWTPREVIDLLPEIAISVIGIRHGNNAVRTLNHQLIGPASGRESIVMTGRRLGVTRERPRQIQSAAINTLQRIIGRNDYSSCAFYIRPEYLMQLRRVIRHIKTLPQPLPYSKWNAYLQKKWRLAPEHIANAERLLLEICGLKLLTFRGNILKPLICRDVRPKIKNVAAYATALLTETHPEGLRDQDLQKAVRKKFKSSFGLNELRAIFQSLIGITYNRGFWMAETATLRSAVDRFERVLEESGKPLHYREIVKRAFGQDSEKRYSDNSAGTVLTKDRRFVPAGGRGCWALAKWKPDTRTIVQVCVDELKKAGRPLRAARLYRAILKSRSVKFASMRKLLSASSDVRSLRRSVWDLA
jgi:hypothetical protein